MGSWDPLGAAGRQAKWVLAAGLFAAILLPGVADFLSGWLLPLIMVIMVLGAARIPPDALADIWRSPTRSVVQILGLQVIPSAILIVVFAALGAAEYVWAIVLLLLCSAPAIMSAPNLAAILGLRNTNAMRLVVWGTLLVPLTSVPALYFLFGGEDVVAVLAAAVRLALIILVSGGVGIFLRRTIFRDITDEGNRRLDGASAVTLSIFVMALMPAFTETLIRSPIEMAGWLILAFAVNLLAQVGMHRMVRQNASTDERGALALAAGNRNLALFFAALPMDKTAALLPFLAAYQVPMYLTPLLLAWLYRRR